MLAAVVVAVVDRVIWGTCSAQSAALVEELKQNK